MICDAHVHIGYFNRKGYAGPFYHSPRRVCTVLRRCGIDEFIFSSTSMQTHGIVFPDVHKESREVVRIWSRGAHPFLWVTKAYLEYDPKLSCLDEDLYEGLKLHGRETPWLAGEMRYMLERVLDAAVLHQMPVIVHTGLDVDSHPKRWLEWAVRYPSVRFDFAHGAPFEEIESCFSESQNVFSDVSCVGDTELEKMAQSKYRDRIMWGTDFPALASRAGISLTQNMRIACLRHNKWVGQFEFNHAFYHYLRDP